jgi:hypothetical protein
MNIGNRFAWVSAYAIAMAFLEAVVVVYIRGLLNITNDHVALGPYVTMEMWREVATIVMLASVGWLAGRRRADRLAYGLFAFGLWDIWYCQSQSTKRFCTDRSLGVAKRLRCSLSLLTHQWSSGKRSLRPRCVHRPGGYQAGQGHQHQGHQEQGPLERFGPERIPIGLAG